MQKYCFMIAAMCCLSAFADDQVTWLQKVHDFGAFDEDTKQKTAYFSFVNTTDEDVSIISATATCGCTTPQYDLSPVAPGDTAVIEVSYDPSGRPGRFEKQVYVRTSDTPERTKLVIKGAVIGNPETINARFPVSMGPVKLRLGAAMMGRAYAGHDKMAYVDGYNMSHDTITPTVVSAPKYIQVKTTPDKVGPGELMSFDFTFCGNACDQWGVLTDSVMIAPTAGAEAYPLPVVVIVDEDFSGLTPQQLRDAPVAAVSTDRLQLGTVPQSSDKPVNGTFTLTNRGTDDLLIRRVYSEDPGVSVNTTAQRLRQNESADIEVTFDPSVQPTGIINARVTVITNDPAKSTQIVRVVGERQ